MRRLEFVRQARRTLHRSNNPADAVMMLAQITLERRRLEQERVSLSKRLRRIDGRLSAIAGAETKLVPNIKVVAQSTSEPTRPQHNLFPMRQRATSSVSHESVVQY